MTCRRAVCHAIQGALLGSLIGHAAAVALRPAKPVVAARQTVRVSPGEAGKAGSQYERP